MPTAPRGAKRARPVTPIAQRCQITAVEIVNKFGAKTAAELLVMRQYAELQVMLDVIGTARASAAASDDLDAEPTLSDYRDALEILEGEIEPSLPNICPEPITRGKLDNLDEKLKLLETRLADTIVPSDVISRLAAIEHIASADENVLNRLARIESRLGIDPRDAKSWGDEIRATRRRVPITAGEGRGAILIVDRDGRTYDVACTECGGPPHEGETYHIDHVAGIVRCSPCHQRAAAERAPAVAARSGFVTCHRCGDKLARAAINNGDIKLYVVNAEPTCERCWHPACEEHQKRLKETVTPAPSFE